MFAEILKNKPHNPHYLNRYIKFIIYCINNPQPSKTEKHHICPKSSDLFPEFASFKKYPWNKASLTLRQHYIAHRLLWKSFGGKQAQAFKIMCDRTNATNSKAYETVRNNHIEYMTLHNHNADGKQSKKAWDAASQNRRDRQAEIMREINKSKKKPKELRTYKCTHCNKDVLKEEFCHHSPKENYYCNAKCRNAFVLSYRKSTFGIAKPYKKGRVAWNKSNPNTGFGNNNPMKDPLKVTKMLETRRINREKKRGLKPL
jgi:hypothetical protein